MQHELAVRRELLNAVVAPIGHENVSMAVDVQAVGHAELSSPVSSLAPAAQILTVISKFLNPVVLAFGHVYVALGVEAYARGAVKLSCS